MTTAKGYVFAEIEVTDPENYRLHYVTRSTPAVERHGGRFLVRGGESTVMRGDATPGRRLVVVEFESYAKALAFHASPEYQEAIAHRDRYATVHRYVVMEGAP